MSQPSSAAASDGAAAPSAKVDPHQVVDLAAARNEAFAQWRKTLQARTDELRARRAEVSAELASARFTATSRDQLVTVTVGTGAALQNVSFGERARSASPAQLTQAIMSAYQQAAKESAEASVAAVSRLAGPGRAEQVRAMLPVLAEDEG